jgi:hypothetical protein
VASDGKKRFIISFLPIVRRGKTESHHVVFHLNYRPFAPIFQLRSGHILTDQISSLSWKRCREASERWLAGGLTGLICTALFCFAPSASCLGTLSILPCPSRFDLSPISSPARKLCPIDTRHSIQSLSTKACCHCKLPYRSHHSTRPSRCYLSKVKARLAADF